MDLVYSSINIYDRFKFKYKDYLKSEINAIVIIQSENAVYLETVETEIVNDGLEKQTTKRINLDFIEDDPDGLFFDPKESIENNTTRFIDGLSPYSIINTTDLFSNEACEIISKKYNTFGVDR